MVKQLRNTLMKWDFLQAPIAENNNGTGKWHSDSTATRF